jgi:hypothetical protein
MGVGETLKRYGTRKVVRRVSRSIPWIGAVVVLIGLGGAIRRKGLVGGVIHSALDAIPFLGAAKNLIEAGRGRDFIRDRPPAPSETRSAV